jgi:hypothetical protein
VAVNVPALPKSRLGKWIVHVHSPIAVALLFVLLSKVSPGVFERMLGDDALVPPPGKIGYERSFHGSLVSTFRHMVRSGPGQPFRVVDDDAAKAELDQACLTRPRDVIEVSCESTIAKLGFWNPTRIEGDRRIVLNGRLSGPAAPINDPSKWPRFTFSPEELEQARAAYFAHINAIDSEFSRDLEFGNQHVLQRLPMGWLKNAAAGVVLALLVFSLIGLPNYLRAAMCAFRLLYGQCGVCRYDLSGTPSIGEGARCPECGSLWDSSWKIRRKVSA